VGHRDLGFSGPLLYPLALPTATSPDFLHQRPPEIEKRLRWQWRCPQSNSWRVDETYVKVGGKWAYLYRAVDKHGNTIDVHLSPTRNTAAAKRFLSKALNGLNNVVEAYHGKLIRPVRGFKTLKTAYATIKGVEGMRALRKGQASSFNIIRDIPGEARLVERAFNLGPCVLAEAMQFISQQLELQAA
jgi:transposase-like protein